MRKLYLWIVIAGFLGGMAGPVHAHPTAQGAACPGSLPSRLAPGMSGRVTPGDANKLRDQASLVGNAIGSIPGGASFQVLAGPVCADGYTWYQVEYQGLTGWTVEGADVYWLEPVATSTAEPTVEDSPAFCPPEGDPRYVQPRLGVNTAARVIADVPLRVRTEPHASASVQYQVSPGAVAWIIDGPQCEDGFTWWTVEGTDTAYAWIAEGQNGEYWLEPLPVPEIPVARAPITWNTTDLTALGTISFDDVRLTMIDLTTSADGTPWLAAVTQAGDILLQTLYTHQITTLAGPVATLAFDAAGTRLVSGGEDGIVQLRDLQAPEVVRFTWDHGSAVKRVIFSETTVAAAGGSQVHLWDAVTGETITTLDVPQAEFFDLALSPDGTRIAAASSYTLPSLDPLEEMPPCPTLDCMVADVEFATIHLWDAVSYEELPYLTVHHVAEPYANALTFMAFNTSGQRVITSDIMGFMQQWSVNTLADQTGGWDLSVYAPTIRLSRDQSWAVALGSSGPLLLLDMTTGEPVAQPLMRISAPEGQGNPAQRLALSPDETLVATLVTPQQVIIWGGTP